MRSIAIIPLLCLLTACLAPGERDPTRYPWDPRNRVAPAPAPHPPVVARGLVPRIGDTPHRQPVRPQDSYCILEIEQESTSGIAVSADTGVMACGVQPNSPPKGRPPRE